MSSASPFLRALAAAVLTGLAIVAAPATGGRGAATGLAAMAEGASGRSCHRRSGHSLGDRWRRRRGLRQGAHPGRGAQRLRQGRLARDAQRRAVHAADTAGAREADRRDRHRRGQPRRRGAGRRERDRLRLRGARLLDAEGRRPSGGVDPRRRLRRLAGRRVPGRDRPANAIAQDFQRQARRKPARRGGRGRESREVGWSDARRCAAGKLFHGKQKAPASKAYGHIPGARNLDSAAFYDPVTNRLRPKDELAAIAASLPAEPVVAYCNTGHWAATDWFVLSVVLGRPDVRLYDGSMVEWTADARRPVASERTRWDDVKKALGLGS